MSEPRTVVVRTGGGAIYTMDVPTVPRAREKFDRRIERGELVIIEGSLDPVDESPAGDDEVPVDPSDSGEPPAEVDERASLTKAQLVAVAAELGITGAAAMAKAELLAAIEAAQADADQAS